MDNILGPESISEAALKILRATIDLVADNKMIGREDSKKALAILNVNPHRRLSLLGKRLARIQADVSELTSIHMGLEDIANESQRELDLLTAIIEWQPEWRPDEPTNVVDMAVQEEEEAQADASEEIGPQHLNLNLRGEEDDRTPAAE